MNVLHDKAGLRQKFLLDLEEIARSLTVAYKLEYKEETENLNSPLMRWMDFRLRYIEPTPRKLVLSNAFPKKLPKTVRTALAKLQEMMQAGEDINQYQSKSIVRFNDTSGQNKSKRTDLLWADWGITHLHLTDIPVILGSSFSERACSDEECWLLFCIVNDAEIGLVDVRRHDDESLFSDTDLIDLVYESWPQYMDQFQLKGIVGLESTPSDKDIAKLRRAGVNTPIVIDGKVYFSPGLGINTAATSGKCMKVISELRYWVSQVADIASDPDGEIQNKIADLKTTESEISLALTPAGLAIYLQNLDHAYNLRAESKNDYFNKMHDLMIPPWVLAEIIKAHASSTYNN